jgi:hypothetical protein
VVKENTALPKFARNSYISSLSSSVFCRFRGILGCGVASIFIEGDFGFSLFYLFCLFYNAFSVSVNVTRNNANSLSSSIYSLF